MDNCIFCQIVKGNIDTEFLYQSDVVVAFKDVNPIAPVHILIIPTKHIQSMNDVTETDLSIVSELFKVAISLAKEQGIAEDGYKLLIRTGENGGQEVPHIHLHLIGGAKLNEKIYPVQE